MNEPTQTPAVEQVVPVPVPVPPSKTQESNGASGEDQLPTSRLPSIPAPLPPPVPPQGPAHKTQPLRAITRDAAAARLAVEAKRQRWQAVLAHVKRAAAGVPSRFGGLGGEPWTERRIGTWCAVVGFAMIAGSLGLGWESVASERFEKVEHVPLAVALVLARAAIAIATMAVGYGLLRVGERTAFASNDRKGH
jgi:hypothetical protein